MSGRASSASTDSGHLFTLDPARAYPVLDHADHVYVWDVDGNRYFDAVAGLGVVNIGYGRTEVAEAMAQADAAPWPDASAAYSDIQSTGEGMWY